LKKVAKKQAAEEAKASKKQVTEEAKAAKMQAAEEAKERKKWCVLTYTSWHFSVDVTRNNKPLTVMVEQGCKTFSKKS
jgi:predicted aspartyl protease